MEAFFQSGAGYVAMAAEFCAVLCIGWGTVETFVRAAWLLGRRRLMMHDVRRKVWVSYAAWIILALEFALAADIARTAIAPSWDDIGHLAAIAAIRTFLNFFLDRDLSEFNSEQEAVVSERREPALRDTGRKPGSAGS